MTSIKVPRGLWFDVAHMVRQYAGVQDVELIVEEFETEGIKSEKFSVRIGALTQPMGWRVIS